MAPGDRGCVPRRRRSLWRRCAAAGALTVATFESVDLAPGERSAYASLAAVFTSAYAAFRRMAPGASWVDFTHHAARTAEGRRALAAFRQMRRLVAFTQAKRQALKSLLGRHCDSRVLVFTADNDTAYAIAREHLVMPLTCDIGRGERDEVLGALIGGNRVRLELGVAGP